MSASLLETLRTRFPGRVDEATLPTLRPADEAELIAALGVLRAQGGRLGRDLRLSRAAFNRLGRIEAKSATVEVGAGVTLEALDRHARREGFCLGPLSPRARALELAAFLEGEHAGLRAISGGRLEPLALSLRAILPGGGVFQTASAPRSAAGPGLDALLLGGQGRLGLIVSAVVRLWPVPARTEDVTVAFPDGAALVRALRTTVEQGAPIHEALLFRRASAHVAHVRFAGTEAGAVRDANTLARRAAAEHGRLSEADLPAFIAATEQELGWEEVVAALHAERPLRLHRVALDSVVAELPVAPAPLQTPTGWFDAVATALDPDGILRGET